MTTSAKKISAVPTNIITGFLGVGKTSAILHLLSTKPQSERWAVLVNEFGEIGVDGSLFEGHHNEQSGVFIREVPGGCMCCTAGLPMQIALNQLLMRAKPDRLLIEPTGLGHPKEVLQSLSSDYYADVLDLQKILTLVDARKLADERYITHDTFVQQIAIADIVVGNKLDLYTEQDKTRLLHYAKKHASTVEPEIIFTQQGNLAPEVLVGKTQATATTESHHHHHIADESRPLLSDTPIPECGYIKATNQGENFNSIGWRFSPTRRFSHQRLFSWLHGVNAERLKAVLITDRGIFGYNLTSDALTEIVLDECLESRIEIIADRIDAQWESQLMECLLP